MRSNWKRFSVILLFLAAFALALSGCSGSDGTAGPAGPQGPKGDQGLQGVAGADKTTGTVDAAQLTADDLRNIALGGKIISASTAGDQPVVTFQVVNKASNQGIRGLRTFALHIAQLKPAVDGSASYWQNYISSGLPLTAVPAFTERGATVQTAPVNPAADGVTVFNSDGSVKAQGYTVVDNGDGTYVVTFGAKIKQNTKVSYDATLVHRIGVGVRSVVVPGVVGKTPGAYAGPIDPATGAVFASGQFTNINGANLIYDFTPAATGNGTTLVDSAGKQTFARDIVNSAACNQCHYKIEYGFPAGNNTSGHFGSRPDTRLCVMCHTPQLAFVKGTGDFTSFIHKIHMGEELPDPTEIIAYGAAPGTDLGINEFKYPQDQRNCATCHKGTVANSWQKLTRGACGSCHNNINFTAGTYHKQADDKSCALCHDTAEIASNHVPVAAVTSATSGVTSRYANNNKLPTGAFKIEYVISGVTVDTARNVSIKFQIKKDGTAVNFGAYNATTNPNIVPNTIGGPSIRIAYNITQDGIASPADTNAYMSVPALGIGAPTVTSSTATPPSTFTPPATTTNLWVNGTITASGITWTLTGPDTNGDYTIKSSLPLPASTTMVTAFMYGSMTQTNLTTYPFAAASIADFKSYAYSATETRYALAKPGLILSPSNASKSLTSTGFTARRAIVSNAKCNSCHDQLGVKPNFHGGGRNDGTTCGVCHTPNSSASGWSWGFNTFIHGIHGAAMRTKAYTFASDWSTVGYPALLKNCEMCHVSGSYDFTGSANSAAVGKLLYNTVGTGTTVAAGANTAPYIAQAAGTVYGSGFAYSTTTGAVVTTPAADTTLVSSPISAACFSCHDSAAAMTHMRAEGGSLYEARSSALLKTEACLVCHGRSSNNGPFNDTVPGIKAVHRWW